VTVRRMLVIDDEPDIAEFVGQVGEGLGYEVRVTSDVESFKASFEGYSPDVVVLDVVMPEIDGIEIVKYLAANNCEARILVISGYAQRYLDNTKVLGEAFGLQSITAMTKPIDLLKLEDFLSAT
jgi:DNA-binding response OmpR family regulator